MGCISGICGEKIKNKAFLTEKMVEITEHRSNFYHIDHSFCNVCLGVRFHSNQRLSHSFVCNNSQNLLVSIDGDIFDYCVDRQSDGREIEDAQLIHNLYLRYGKKFANKIDGAYSITIWDGQLGELILIRDRVGSKPLFYVFIKDGFVFSSEIKGILKTGLYDKSVDLCAVDSFLSYWYVPNPSTIFKSVSQVRPGHMVIYKQGKVTEENYWCFKDHFEPSIQSEEAYCEQFYDIFLKAVSRRVKKYPNSGAFLSGGMDSSSVAAVMKIISDSDFKVFSVGFTDQRYNEIDDAKIVSGHLGLRHYSEIIELDNDFPGLLEKLVWFHDAPFVDTSAIPSYFASKLAKKYVDVVFTGDFPDQILAGSSGYLDALDRKEHDIVYKFIFRNKLINRIVKMLPLSSGTNSFLDKAKRKIYRETFPIEMQRIISNMPVPELMKPCLYSSDMMEITWKNKPLSYADSLFNEVDKYDLLEKMLYFDAVSYAPDDLMVKVDRMTMAHTLLAISPFHDKEFVEFATALPSSLKIKGKEGKYIMKKAMGHLLPKHTLQKKKKALICRLTNGLSKKIPTMLKSSYWILKR